MTKNIILFLATFVIGALIALVARTATHEPYAEPAAAPRSPERELGDRPPAATASAHAAHTTAPAPSAKPVNTVCAICGMEVDPDIPSATYQGKPVGFGCRACPAKFAKDPDRYGPAALRNEVVK